MKFSATHACFKGGNHRGHFINDRLVLFRHAEAEKLGRIFYVAPKLFEGGNRLLNARALAGNGLSFLRVVPKTGSERGVVQFVDVALESIEVKDAPLAS